MRLSGVLAQPAAGPQAAASIADAAPLAGAQLPALAFEKYRLANGLEVILHSDHSLPLVAVNLWYHVGPANEPAGRSGFAHLFEHLMFEGSKHVGKRFDPLLESAGATNSNATTSWDRTNYFETVPREHLELALWLESDRMGFMVESLTKQRFHVQRNVVLNERRQSYENSPYGPSTLALLDALFPPGHPYHGAIIGSVADLRAATLQDVRDFFTAFYAPGNATLVLAGDFDSNAARRMIERYFGTLPPRVTPRRARQVTPPLAAARRQRVNEPVELAKVSMAWIAPPAYSPTDLPLDLAMAILAQGKATRLYRSLVVEQRVASGVDAALDSNDLCSIALLSATVASGKTVQGLEKSIDQVLAELATNGPTDAELIRAKRQRLVDIASELQELNGPGGDSGRAGLLQRFNHYLGDPGYLETYLRQLQSVSNEDVRRAVQQVLKPDSRAVVITEPTPGDSTGGKR